jgi:hypothetical protein
MGISQDSERRSERWPNSGWMTELEIVAARISADALA